MFRHGDLTKLGHCGTWTFWHMEISALCRNVYIALHSAKMYMCQNVHVLKYRCAKISQFHNIPVPKRPWCRNIPMSKYSRAEKSPWLNVCRDMSLAEMSDAEMSGAKISQSLRKSSLIYATVISLTWLKRLWKKHLEWLGKYLLGNTLIHNSNTYIIDLEY